MINLFNYIMEKLHLDKGTEIKDFTGVKDIRISWPEPKDYQKMRDYKAKGSKPERLVNSIKDRGKLERRFRVAIEMKWQDAITVFGDALVDRNYFSRDEVDKYIADSLKRS